MAKPFDSMEDSNRSGNPSLHELSDPARRTVLRGAAGSALMGLIAALVARSARAEADQPGRAIGFDGVPMPSSAIDSVLVPKGYTARVLYRWGDATGIAGAMPAFAPDASNPAADQQLQAGMHHDGMHYFPMRPGDSRRGLLVLNHEYVDNDLLFSDGSANWSAGKVAKAMAAHGVSVVEVERSDAGWRLVRPSRYARRITATTPMVLAGPAAGHLLMRTKADPSGTRVLGTFNNCAHGVTPWGTYLTCEENFADYFRGPDAPDAHLRRWGIQDKGGSYYRWHEHEPRFDARIEPNESNRFGWVVEIDPFDPAATPVKRTALGRAAHEGAACAQTRDGRVVIYMGEDARFEYLYKFVSRDAAKPGGAKANRDTLDHGTLYVARFDADGGGRWLPMVHGMGPLTQTNGYDSQADVLVKSRQAADALGATRMDRPEWTAIDPINHDVYVTLTNNSQRGAIGRPGVDAANPRTGNTMGHILRWREDGDLDATRFAWSHFVLAGDPANERDCARGNVKGDLFGSPDGLWIDPRGVMWIQTDASSGTMGRRDYARLPNNQVLACDPTVGEMRRFLVGPAGCEVAGLVTTPDLRTMFVNIQHPGEPEFGKTPVVHTSHWPDGGRPRSATVVITKDDGGVIGT